MITLLTVILLIYLSIQVLINYLHKFRLDKLEKVLLEQGLLIAKLHYEILQDKQKEIER